MIKTPRREDGSCGIMNVKYVVSETNKELEFNYMLKKPIQLRRKLNVNIVLKLLCIHYIEIYIVGGNTNIGC